MTHTLKDGLHLNVDSNNQVKLLLDKIERLEKELKKAKELIKLAYVNGWNDNEMSKT